MRLFSKTTAENIEVRLFLRYAALVLSAFLLWLRLSPTSPLPVALVPLFSCLPVPLSLAAALLAVPSTYLSLLSLLVGAWHAVLFAKIWRLVRAGTLGFLSFNAALMLILFSLVLFLLTAKRACRFAFENGRRNAALLFSRAFLKYLLAAVLFTALSLPIYFLWNLLLTKIPL